MAEERKTGRYRFPGMGAEDNEINGFLQRHFATEATYRTRHLSRIAQNIYYNLGRQWIELDTEVLTEGARGYTFREQTPDAEVELPMPVTNIISPAVDVEFATLAKRQWIPKVPSFSRDPRIRASAKVADDVLKDRLRSLDWPEFRDRFIMNMIVMGTSTIRSFWEETYYETSWTAVEEPYRCVQCEALFASRNVGQGTYEFMKQGGNVESLEPDIDKDMPSVDLDECPNCGSKLAPTELTEQQSHGADFFSRPLGEDLPHGGTGLELISPFEYFPENAGIDMDATTRKPRVHGIAKIRSLDWVEEHHPDLVDKIEPEEAGDLMREHPLLGEWDIVGRHDADADSGIYDHHVRVFDMIAEPCMRFPDGRFIRVVGRDQGIIAVNDTLVRKVKGPEGEVGVPVQAVFSAVWKPREGEFWGKSLPDDLISIQNRINGMDAQTIEARERMGSPNLLVPSDANLQGPEYRAGYGNGKFFYWDPSPIAPDSEPTVFGSILMPSGVYNERNACMEDSTRIIGPADIESGEAPRNVTTTSGLQILGEQAERRRATRERGITTVFQKVWEHQLQMLWTLRLDLDSYEAENPDGSWEIKQYDRQALMGQTKVEIERQAYIDKSIIQRESTREALTDGLYDPSTPHARKKLLELMGLPTDVNEESNLQIEHAQRQWVDFVDQRKIPVIDPSVDDPMIRYVVLGTYFMQEEGKQISEQALWPQILPHIAGWEAFLQQLQMQDAQVRAKYGQFIGQEEANQLYAQAMVQYQEAMTAYDDAQAVSKGMGQPMSQPPPEEPPKPVFMPRQPEHQVYAVWQQMLNTNGALVPILKEASATNEVPPETLAEVVDTYMRFRSVFEAYRIMQPAQAAPMPGTGPEEAAGGASPAMQEQGPAPTSGSPPMPETAVR